MSVSTLNFILASATVVAQLFVLAAFADLAFAKGKYLIGRIAPYALRLALLAALGASALTLVYELGFGVPPCPLCWWQRIFLYPQVVILALGLRYRDRRAADYGIALSVLGLGVALYHHALQIFPNSLPCPAEALCAQRHVFEFGYVTFPLMAATAFALLFVLCIASKRRV